MDRGALLAKFHRCLNTEDGKAMMDELKIHWASGNPLDPEPATMGFNIGLLEAYRQLESWMAAKELKE